MRAPDRLTILDQFWTEFADGRGLLVGAAIAIGPIDRPMFPESCASDTLGSLYPIPGMIRDSTARISVVGQFEIPQTLGALMPRIAARSSMSSRYRFIFVPKLSARTVAPFFNGNRQLKIWSTQPPNCLSWSVYLSLAGFGMRGRISSITRHWVQFLL